MHRHFGSTDGRLVAGRNNPPPHTSLAGTDELDHERTVADFPEGKKSGLERVYRVYGTPLYSVARHVLGNDEDAQDCVHDALLRVWQRSQSFRSERGSLRSYLLGCVRNEAITRKRNAVRHFRSEERAVRSDLSVYELEVSDPVERERLHHALAKLPTEQRTALELAYFGQLSQAQIAERLDIPIGTVKSRLAMALRKLHAVLTANGRTTR